MCLGTVVKKVNLKNIFCQTLIQPFGEGLKMGISRLIIYVFFSWSSLEFLGAAT